MCEKERIKPPRPNKLTAKKWLAYQRLITFSATQSALNLIAKPPPDDNDRANFTLSLVKIFFSGKRRKKFFQ